MRENAIRERKDANPGTAKARKKLTDTRIGRNRIAALAVAFLVLCPAAFSQIGHPPSTPTINGSHELRITDRELPAAPKRLDLARLHDDALALATAANAIPAGVESVTKGMLPKDILQKLKQIEKLSKRLRSELNPWLGNPCPSWLSARAPTRSSATSLFPGASDSPQVWRSICTAPFVSCSAFLPLGLLRL